MIELSYAPATVEFALEAKLCCKSTQTSATMLTTVNTVGTTYTTTVAVVDTDEVLILLELLQ